MIKAIPQLLITIMITLIVACEATKDSQLVQYPRNIGDIASDPALDDPEFVVCNDSTSYQYYNFPHGFPFEGEKIRLVQTFKNELANERRINQSGYVTIRFIVNCKGESGRFRVQQMDINYNPIDFDRIFVQKLLNITKNLKGWAVIGTETQQFDYYLYLTFKIEDGAITEILP